MAAQVDESVGLVHPPYLAEVPQLRHTRLKISLLGVHGTDIRIVPSHRPGQAAYKAKAWLPRAQDRNLLQPGVFAVQIGPHGKVSLHKAMAKAALQARLFPPPLAMERAYRFDTLGSARSLRRIDGAPTRD